MIEAAALQFAHDLRSAQSLLEEPPYEEPPDPSPAEIESGTRRILDVEAARFLAQSADDPMHAVAWFLCRNFGHRPIYLNGGNGIWHLGTLSPTYEQWLLLIRKSRHAMTVQAADGTTHGPRVESATLLRALKKVGLTAPEAIR